MYIHVKNEVFMTTYMDRRANKTKLPKCLPFKNYKSESLHIRCAYMGAYVHKYTKYEVSMSNPVPREVCTDNADTDADANTNDDNRQFMIV